MTLKFQYRFAKELFADFELPPGPLLAANCFFHRSGMVPLLRMLGGAETVFLPVDASATDKFNAREMSHKLMQVVDKYKPRYQQPFRPAIKF